MIKQFEDENTVAKQTIPSPAQFLAQFLFPFNLESTFAQYESEEAFIDDVVEVYNEFIRQLYDAGCRNLQLDDCTWGMFTNKSGSILFGTTKEGTVEVQKKYKDVNNRVIDAAPDNLVVTTHVCRGNYHSTYISSGPYDAVADVLLGEENVSAFFLEFDDERSGGFEPLAKVPEDKKVVLGLVTTKRPELEDKAVLHARIKEASKYVPLERLYLSPQCGFASCEIGNKLTEEEQWAKLRLVKEVAEEVWGQN